jgi:SAM-dependent methyltransferase
MATSTTSCSDRTDQAGESEGAVIDEGWTDEINTGVAHPARIYDYYLGGKDNFRADREAAELALAATPSVREMAIQNRAFLRRAVRFLAGQARIRQYLDIGTGLPTQGNVHEIAQATSPEARVVYVDNDPIVLAHSRALLDAPNTTAVLGDLREPGEILEDPAVTKLIDFDRPVAILLVAVLHFIKDAEDPGGITAQLRRSMAPGSHLVISHGTTDVAQAQPEVADKVLRAYQRSAVPVTLRPRQEIGAFFGDFELLDPGLEQVQMWRPDGPVPAVSGGILGGVGRKR